MHKTAVVASSSSSRPSGSQQQHGKPSQMSPIEQLIYRLCQKIAVMNNLNEKTRDEFVNPKYGYLIKLFCSDAYSPVYDAFEVSEKIRKKRKNIEFLLI
jgi:hypothetical protein